MKKTVIAAALAVMSTVAMAQDAKVYGVFDVSEYQIHQDGGKKHMGFNSKALTTSRFGFVGTEDIGGGVKAGANLETELNLATGVIGSTGTGTGEGTFNRAANVFLSDKNKGTLTLGRMNTPLFNNTGTGDALGVNSLGFSNAIAAADANTNTITGETRAPISANVKETSPGRVNAGIAYQTPTFAGFTATVFTTPGTGSANTDSASYGQRDLVVTYGDTRLNAVVGQRRFYNVNGTVNNTTNLYAANYTVGAIKVTGGIYQKRYDTQNDIDVKSVGVKYQVNPRAAVGVEYTTAEDKTTTANKSTVVGLGGTYDLSKRTTVYALAGQSKNEGASSMNPIYGGPSIAAGKDQLAYTVGMKHSF